LCCLVYYGVYTRRFDHLYGKMEHCVETFVISQPQLALLHQIMMDCCVEFLTSLHGSYEDALCWAAVTDHPSIVASLMERGADVHVHNDMPLQLSAKYGNLEIVKLLLGHGADIHANNEAALCSAVKRGHLEIVQFLVANNVNVNAARGRAV